VTSPGFLSVGGVEVANNARTAAYLSRGLGGPWFQSISSTPCADLLLEAWPFSTCPAGATDDTLGASPIASWRNVLTGAVPTVNEVKWFEAGYVGFQGGLPSVGGVLLPNNGLVTQRVRLMIDMQGPMSPSHNFGPAKVINPGTANAGWLGMCITVSAGNIWQIQAHERRPDGGVSSFGTGVTNLFGGLAVAGATGQWVFEVVFGPTGMTAGLYSGDPDNPNTTLIGSGAYTYSQATIGNAWFTATGQTEFASFTGATEVGIVSGVTGPLPTTSELVITSIGIDVPCTKNAQADLFPSDTLFPADDLYPALYGEFHDPATDNAPWADGDRPEGFDYLGLIIDEIQGLDTTSSRDVSPAADGIGGILGPETLDARPVTVKGWLIAANCSGMEYARRWLAETLADALCAGCDLSFMDVRTTCGDDPAGDFNTNRWRLYDVGLTNMDTDLSGGEECCYVVPITFTLTAGNPYLYGPLVNAVGPVTLNAGASDANIVPFETWLFSQGTSVCTTVADQGIGIDAPVITFTGGTSGIDGGVAYSSMGLYPSDGLWPSDCVFPADGTTQWSDDVCPFVFTLSLGAGETFVIDNARRELRWTLADGSVLDGAPKLMMQPGDTITWLDTCAGASIDVCVAAAAVCSCDDTATVQIQTQHRER